VKSLSQSLLLSYLPMDNYSSYTTACFYVSMKFRLKPEFQSLFLSEDGSVKWSKALCHNPLAFTFLKEHMKPDEWKSYHIQALSSHCQDLEFLDKYIEWVDFTKLSANPFAIPLLQKWIEYVDRKTLSRNPAAVSLLIDHPELISWRELCMNPSKDAICLLEKRPKKIDYSLLSGNPSAIHLLENNLGKVDWETLSSNPAAIHLLKKNPHRVSARGLCANPSPEAMEMLRPYFRNRPTEIDYESLNQNPFAHEHLIDHPEQIQWSKIHQNPCALEVIDHFNLDDLRGSMMTIKGILPRLTEYRPKWIALNPDIFEEDVARYRRETHTIMTMLNRITHRSN
jgi:hypothetical protein